MCFFYLLFTQVIPQNKINQDREANFSFLNKEIEELHRSIIELSTIYNNTYKDRKKENKLRIPISLGHHNIFSDSEDYIYRSDAFLYYTGNTPKDILFLHEQTHTNTLFTEIRFLRVNDLSRPSPFRIQISYVNWAQSSESRDSRAALSLIDFSDKIELPLGVQREDFSLQDIKKPATRYKLLVEYRKKLKKLQRTMEYHIQLKDKQKLDKILRGLAIGNKQ